MDSIYAATNGYLFVKELLLESSIFILLISYLRYVLN